MGPFFYVLQNCATAAFRWGYTAPKYNKHFLKKTAVAYHAMVERKNAHVPAMVDVITPNDWVAMVFHPNTSQSVVWDLVVFVDSLNNKLRVKISN